MPAEGNSAETKISDHFGRARFFAVATVSQGSVHLEDFVQNTFRDKPARAGLAAVEEILQQHKVDVVITREIGEIAFHTLRDKYIEIHSTRSTTVRDALDRLARGELAVLVEPTHPSEAAGKPAASGKEPSQEVESN